MKTLFILLLVLFSLPCEAQDDEPRSKLSLELGAGPSFADLEFSEYAGSGIIRSVNGRINFSNKFSLGLLFNLSNLYSNFPNSDSKAESFKINQFFLYSRYEFLQTNLSPFVGLGCGVSNYKEPNTFNGLFINQGAGSQNFGATADIGVTIFKRIVVLYSFNYGGRTAQFPTYREEISNLTLLMHQVGVRYQLNSKNRKNKDRMKKNL